jgi:hypothetical protein
MSAVDGAAPDVVYRDAGRGVPGAAAAGGFLEDRRGRAEMGMEWVMLAIAAAAVVAAVFAVLRRGGGAGRGDRVAAHRQRTRAERIEQPRRRMAQFHTSGVPPRWDP